VSLWPCKTFERVRGGAKKSNIENMCGLAGFIALAGSATLEADGVRMADAIAHRGPDDSGVWSDAAAGVCLAHRRLSIIDRSTAGHQPMRSTSGRFVLVFNGEIYNHLDIRDELTAAGAAPVWRGHSDTETLLAAFEHWGVKATVSRAVGMFAIALWDRRERRLTLVRDRLGEKPLYHGWVGRGANRTLVFGSELKALRAYPGFDNGVSRDALALYMQHCAVPAPYSIYRDIFKLAPGHMLTFDLTGSAEATRIETFWRLSDVVRQGMADPIRSEAEAVAALEVALSRSVSLQAVADVPVGVFLSGGVDSSTIAALMQAQSGRRIQTFTVGFDDEKFDEAPHARAVARHLGTDHHETRLTPADALSVISRLPTLYDEPFADSSQIPSHLICREARQRVTVAMSGDAGDELFGGYNRYFWSRRIWRRVRWLSPGLRRQLATVIHLLPTSVWDGVGASLPGGIGVSRLGDKAYKLAHRLKSVNSVDDLYRSLVTEWPASVVRGADRLPTLLDDSAAVEGVSEAEHRMMFWDSLTYLPDDILTKVDRAAMGIGLETRAPFLDHRVVELAWRLPLQMKMRQGMGKWALRQVLYKYVPRELIERPKTGFGVPIGDWLRGPLRDWAGGLLEESRLIEEGYLEPAPIRETWKQHLSGRYDWTARLWCVLMFEAWLRINR
jgi:asparagine synthase (glutamine-hydrolysing)